MQTFLSGGRGEGLTFAIGGSPFDILQGVARMTRVAEYDLCFTFFQMLTSQLISTSLLSRGLLFGRRSTFYLKISHSSTSIPAMFIH